MKTNKRDREKELYEKWKAEHGDVAKIDLDPIMSQNPTTTEWWVRNYVNTRLLPYIQDNFILKDVVRERIEADRVLLREKEDHLPAAYQYLKGKNDLRDDLLKGLLEE